MDDLYRIEQTISAVTSGDMDPAHWPHSCILALGLSGRRNPLGAAVFHLIEHPNADNYRAVMFYLSSEVVRAGIATEKMAVDVAKSAILWHENSHCPTCSGRGVLNFEQDQCVRCGGTGDRRRPSNKATADAVSMISEALDRLERQQRSRLGGD